MPGMCIPNGLPIDLGVPLPYGRDSRRVQQKMLGLVEGGGLPTVAELVKKWEEEGEEEEEEQGEQPPAAGEAGPSEAPEPAEVGPVGPSMLLGEEAQEERREAPTSRYALGKERAIQVTAPPETDEEMARRLQVQEEEEEARKGQDAATLMVVREAAGSMMWGQVEGLEAPS